VSETTSETAYSRAGGYCPTDYEGDSVRLDACSAGVAASGRHGGLLAVLRGSLSHSARPHRFHGRSVAALREEGNCARSGKRLRQPGEHDVLELDAGIGRQVGGRARARDELGQAGDVVCLHVRLEDRHDWRTQRGRCGEVVVDEVGVRVDDRELGVRASTEQVAGTRGLVVQKRA
jgi:hypothetical protein